MRAQKPVYKLTPTEENAQRAELETMQSALENATACVDTSAPKEAWHYRSTLDKTRQKSLNNPRNKATQAYQVAWSSQMKEQAAQMLAMHKRRSQRPEKCAIDWNLTENIEDLRARQPISPPSTQPSVCVSHTSRATYGDVCTVVQGCKLTQQLASV